MQKTMVISLLIGCNLLWYFFTQPLENNYDKKIYDLPINQHTELVGYRNNTGGATVPFTYAYFILNNKKTIDQVKPFLISSTESITAKAHTGSAITITLSGKIYHFTNAVWVKDTHNQLYPITINLQSTYTYKKL